MMTELYTAKSTPLPILKRCASEVRRRGSRMKKRPTIQTKSQMTVNPRGMFFVRAVRMVFKMMRIIMPDKIYCDANIGLIKTLK